MTDTKPSTDDKTSSKDKTKPGEREKVCLVGSASSSSNQCPYDDMTFDIWGLAWRSLKRCDAYFDLHPMDESRKNIQQNYIGRLSSLKSPIYLQKKHPAIPNSFTYPIEEVIKCLSSGDPYANGDYFASSIAFMLALAICNGYKEIHLYGIDLLCNDEYSHQRPNAEYLIGIARGLGIHVFIPKESAMCKFPYRYGYEKPTSTGLIDIELLNDRKKGYRNKQEEAKCLSYMADGAGQAMDELLKLLDHQKRGGKLKGKKI